MPHVEIKCFTGRTEEQKKRCAEKVAQDIAEIFGCETTSVSVAIKDVAREEWKEKVWDAAIVPDQAFLYKKPGYSYEEDEK